MRAAMSIAWLIAGAAATGCIAPDDTSKDRPSSHEDSTVVDEGIIVPSKLVMARPENAAVQPDGYGDCSYDLYFHPNNGAAAGYIEEWRLCSTGGTEYQICTGGYAPVRYYNSESCGGTVYDYYPQGWHGTAQTYKTCCTL